MNLRESSNFEDTTESGELSDWQKDNMSCAEQLTASQKPVDKRLINLYMMMKARQMGHAFGFDNDLLTGRKSKEILKKERDARKRHYKKKIEENQIEVDTFRTDKESDNSGDLSMNSVMPTVQKPYEQDNHSKAEEELTKRTR